MNFQKNSLFILCFIVIFLYIGCSTFVEGAGRALDGSAFAEKKVAVYRTEKNAAFPVEIRGMQNKAGEISYIITLSQFPAMNIRVTAPENDGTVSLMSMNYLGGNTNGWNEYQLDLFGNGKLLLNETSAAFSVQDKIEQVQISWGRIRRYDNRITGDEALTGLRNRRERIIAIAENMNGIENAPVGIAGRDFEKHWKSLLFPEAVAKKKRPENWQQENDQFVKSEGIRWNTGYTERTFPKLLREIRNSGTMLRDWEEAAEWLYIEYEWKRITEQLSHETVLTKVKR